MTLEKLLFQVLIKISNQLPLKSLLRPLSDSPKTLQKLKSMTCPTMNTTSKSSTKPRNSAINKIWRKPKKLLTNSSNLVLLMKPSTSTKELSRLNLHTRMKSKDLVALNLVSLSTNGTFSEHTTKNARQMWSNLHHMTPWACVIVF